jgi:hypothetical protein
MAPKKASGSAKSVKSKGSTDDEEKKKGDKKGGTAIKVVKQVKFIGKIVRFSENS